MNIPLQSTSKVIMIEPQGFYANPQTLSTNKHQQPDNSPQNTLQAKALKEHQALVAQLRSYGIDVTVFKGQQDTPDDLFCNNWISFHDKGPFILYPLLAPNRRLERRLDLCERFQKEYGNPIDLSYFEQSEAYLESTGSMVLDRVHQIAFAASSPRTDRSVFLAWCEKLNYRPIFFHWHYPDNTPVYHTNVMMFIGTEIAGICLEGIQKDEADTVRSALSQYHEILALSFDQIENYCGNAIELRNHQNERFIAMSTRAYQALTTTQVQQLKSYYQAIIHADIPTIEQYGGGSVRCLILEQF